MTLASEVQARHGGATSQRLIQLTNDDSTATTINTTVLNAAAVDAQGLFEDISGITLDITQKNHLYVAINATIMFLEEYKSRDGNILTMRRKSVLGALAGMRKRAYIMPDTNSNLVARKNDETYGDMDTRRAAFQSRKSARIEEYIDE